MELKELIERAEKAAGSQKALSLRIGQSTSRLRDAKSGRCGLPNYACVMIADLIGVDRITVIAASELVTEKKEERRKVWHPFVARAASVILGAVILNMTPTPAEAAPLLQVVDSTVYIMSNWLMRKIKKMAAAFAGFCGALPRIFSPLPCFSG